MYFMALAVDYDGTLADEGKVSAKTLDALVRIKESGRKLIMVTGRQLDDLKENFDHLKLFDRVVAENGALIYAPQTENQQTLAEPPPEKFLENLKNKGVIPVLSGKVIVSTWEPQETIVLDVIRDMGLEMEIIFNKGAVMVLPSGVNKATGLAIAIKELGLSMHNIIGIGDAENDHAFLKSVGLGVAVANAYDSVKKSANIVTKKSCGEGVQELIDQLLEDEHVLLGKSQDTIVVGLNDQGEAVELNPNDCVLIAGNSGIGKSTLATALTEKMTEKLFQFCVFDPEGDYENLENAISIGNVKHPPSIKQVINILQEPTRNVVVNTLGVDIKDRPSFFIQLTPELVSLKASTGRPHWMIIDEAHHLIPNTQEEIFVSLPKEGCILITVHPDEIASEALKALNVMIILGPQAPSILKKLSALVGQELPQSSIKAPNNDEVLIWKRAPVNTIKAVKAEKPKQEHKRHTRKYAEGDLDEEFCFYFKGPNNALNLKAQNLIIFVQIAQGVDDATWEYHLHKKDYSDWFRTHIKDSKLAERAGKIEDDNFLSAAESRQAICDLVKELYTAPASEKS